MQEIEDYEEIRCKGVRSAAKRVFKGIHRRREKMKSIDKEAKKIGF